MRITSGLHRGRLLDGPGDDSIRPTADKVRHAIFNILESRGRVADAFVLDGFCGTGALGIEALSNGAAKAIFFDKSRKAVALCQANVARLGLEAQARVMLRDALAPGPRGGEDCAATLVFLDPPYRKRLAATACAALQACGWIAPGACLVVECAAGDEDRPAGMEILVEKRYGDTCVVVGLLPE